MTTAILWALTDANGALWTVREETAEGLRQFAHLKCSGMGTCAHSTGRSVTAAQTDIGTELLAANGPIRLSAKQASLGTDRPAFYLQQRHAHQANFGMDSSVGH